MNSPTKTRFSAGRLLSQSIRAALVWGILCGLLYPAVSVALHRTLFPWQATGSLVEANGELIGSQHVAQEFVASGHFVSRPSAAGYNPMAQAGSNLAVSNPALRERVAALSQQVQEREGVAATQIPADLLAASGGGIDPHISVEAALLQLPRVARETGIAEQTLRQWVDEATASPVLGIFGNSAVHVLTLNLKIGASLNSSASIR